MKKKAPTKYSRKMARRGQRFIPHASMRDGRGGSNARDFMRALVLLRRSQVQAAK